MKDPRQEPECTESVDDVDGQIVGSENQLIGATAFGEGLEQLAIKDSTHRLAAGRRRTRKGLAEVAGLDYCLAGRNGKRTRFPRREAPSRSHPLDSGNKYLPGDEVPVTQSRQFLQVSIQPGKYVGSPCDGAVVGQRVRCREVVVVTLTV